MQRFPNSPLLQKRIYNPITKRYIQNTSTNRKSIIRQIEKANRNKLVLIACSKTKSFKNEGERIEAGDAYCSPLFQKSKQWAELRGYPYAIISAKYGLIFPDEKIQDYDLTLNELNKKQLENWKRNVAEQIEDYGRWKVGVESWEDMPRIIALAGKSYTDNLEDALEYRIEIEEPLKGLQVGERLSKLNEMNKDWKDSGFGFDEESRKQWTFDMRQRRI